MMPGYIQERRQSCSLSLQEEIEEVFVKEEAPDWDGSVKSETAHISVFKM